MNLRRIIWVVVMAGIAAINIGFYIDSGKLMNLCSAIAVIVIGVTYVVTYLKLARVEGELADLINDLNEAP